MGLFDRVREQAAAAARRRQHAAQAMDTLHQLSMQRITTQSRLKDWEAAVRMLRHHYTREQAANNPAVAEHRIAYLEVPEPQPALDRMG